MGPGARKSPKPCFFADFSVFWQSRHAGGILRCTALTTQSFSPNGGFPTPFVPESMFSGRILACSTGIYTLYKQHIASLYSQHSCCGFSTATMCCCGTATALVWLPHSLCGCHTASVWLPHRGHVHGTARARDGTGRDGQCAESLEALPAPTHTQTHTQDRYPALRGDKRKLALRA